MFEEIDAEYPDIQTETYTRESEEDKEDSITTIRVACIVNNKIFSRTYETISPYIQPQSEDDKIVRILKRGIMESIDSYLSVAN